MRHWCLPCISPRLVGSLLATSDGSVAVPTNPQPQPDAVTGAETRLVADAEAVVELMERGILPSRNDVRDIAALLRALLASLATLREERDALLADKARLDWLEKFAATGAGLYAESNSDSFDWDSRKDGALRQALDVARAAHQGTEP